MVPGTAGQRDVRARAGLNEAGGVSGPSDESFPAQFHALVRHNDPRVQLMAFHRLEREGLLEERDVDAVLAD